ncbi:hypothetical protein P167DRAFT_536109 [Morchella conica CCBAS932]|uniref:Uncharacterized protein n=1 Tax=Morchella conica CCBAS932 TaxID=1392247 RepID=A0A3N4KP30_9PEZI|nr:hypothetical protein P167DRAFT_536109 [Morchella conica CCBAS932]
MAGLLFEGGVGFIFVGWGLGLEMEMGIGDWEEVEVGGGLVYNVLERFEILRRCFFFFFHQVFLSRLKNAHSANLPSSNLLLGNWAFLTTLETLPAR